MRVKCSAFMAAIIVLGSIAIPVSSAAGIAQYTEKPSNHLVGEIERSSLLKLPHRAWFHRNYTTYFPDLATIKKLKTALNGIQVKAFMGTWCHDSQREVPRFYKILESSGFDSNDLEVVSLNLEKKTSDGLEEGLNILRTPTFIFFKNGVEIGRIVETPRDTLETDTLKIVTGQQYKHSYQD